jgi:ABC-type antimicrobial peptide transport system permease subunit
VRRELQSVDTTLPVYGVRSLSEMVTASVAQQRFSAQLVGAFAGLAMLIAAIGIYGVVAYAVGQRTREIGIRMALGARRSEVLRLVLWGGMQPIVIGILVGIAAALALSRLMERLLYGVTATDPAVYVAAPLVLIVAAVAASCIPALRATRVDPLDALRSE